MKRLASVFFCLTLCAAIVALSGGVAFVECCHAEAAEAACCCEGGEGCCSFVTILVQGV